MAERYSRNNERDLHSRNIDWGKIIDHALKTEGSVGNVYNRAHTYSVANVYNFMAQGRFEPMASKKRWQFLGRTVLKNAKPSDVIVPTMRRWREKDENGEWQIVEHVTGFMVVNKVYGLSDTEGPELPPLKTPEWDQDTALKNLRISMVPFQHPDLNTQGYSRGREIAINPVAAKPEKTLMHELGHVVLGHTTGEAVEEYHRGIKEFQAEATAYLTLKELDRLDEETATISRGYISGWLEGETPPDKAIQQVFSATDRILRAGRFVAQAALGEA